MLLCATVLLCGGCLSARMTTDLMPQSDPALTSAAGKFHIAGVKFTAPGVADNIIMTRERELLPLLQRECAARYPGLFAEQSTASIPLGVQVHVATDMHSGKTVGWMLGTLMMAGLIFPCPGQVEEAISVSAEVWNGGENMRGVPAGTAFHTDYHSWVTLLTPLGLIPIPGKSDVPKMSGTVFDVAKYEQMYLRQLAEQTATVTAQLVASKDAAHWASQPRAPVVHSVTTHGGGEATALPPPTGIVAPF